MMRLRRNNDGFKYKGIPPSLPLYFAHKILMYLFSLEAKYVFTLLDAIDIFMHSVIVSWIIIAYYFGAN